jgi:uncharacterized membrane protein YczE
MVTGAIVMGFFAAASFAVGMLGAGASWPVSLIGLPVSALTILAAALAQRGAPPRSAAEQERVGTVIGWASTFEGVMIPLACMACGVLGRPDLMMASTAVIVGLHFLPIAYFLNKPGFYASAFAIICIGIGGVAALPAGALRSALIGPNLAAVLWVSCWVRAALTRNAAKRGRSPSLSAH